MKLQTKLMILNAKADMNLISEQAYFIAAIRLLRGNKYLRVNKRYMLVELVG